ncbi:hypothetical protein PHLH8_32700 [Pseudomonas sp. Pc102]|uniref:class I SAM-dependent methyltransferase n=1 Tax=Pseudomonas sp. Pc102 TaxID=2678261 RepID=UPI001BCC3EB7|nr:class I SAM-dependent methyltransferase [Pseudomonas sp. Pc102]BBP83628.1 hypothetical protein PHLH8_32700 [Pseudomonas sp. Pc102]
MPLSPWFGRWRQRQIARRALKAAGEPNLVLDLPCGLGRSWALLAEHPNRFILAADPSREVLDRALATRSGPLVERVRGFQTSVLAIQLPENAVDSILCLQSLSRLSPEQRLMALRELRRVTRDTLILSLPVDGNLEAWHWRRHRGREATPCRPCAATCWRTNSASSACRCSRTRTSCPAGRWSAPTSCARTADGKNGYR